MNSFCEEAEGKTFPSLLNTPNALTWSVKAACGALTRSGWPWVKFRLRIRRVVNHVDAGTELLAAMFCRKLNTGFRGVRTGEQFIDTNDLSSECRGIFCRPDAPEWGESRSRYRSVISEFWGRTWLQTVEILSYWNLGVSLTEFRRLRSTIRQNVLFFYGTHPIAETQCGWFKQSSVA